MAKAGGFFFIVFGVTTLMARLVHDQPDLDVRALRPVAGHRRLAAGLVHGLARRRVRLIPGCFEFTLLGFTWSFNIIIPALIVPGFVFTVPMIYPFIEAWVTGDKREHHLLDRPRNAPTRTGLGVMAITFYLLLLVGGGNDIIASQLHLSINDITNTLRVLVFVAPPLAFMVAKRMCLGLQRKDREKVLHGRETGPSSGPPASSSRCTRRWTSTAAGRSCSTRAHPPAASRRGRTRTACAVRVPAATAAPRLSRFFFEDRVEPVTPEELEAAHGEHHAIEGADHAEAERPQPQPARRATDTAVVARPEGPAHLGRAPSAAALPEPRGRQPVLEGGRRGGWSRPAAPSCDQDHAPPARPTGVSRGAGGPAAPTLLCARSCWLGGQAFFDQSAKDMFQAV